MINTPSAWNNKQLAKHIVRKTEKSFNIEASFYIDSQLIGDGNSDATYAFVARNNDNTFSVHKMRTIMNTSDVTLHMEVDPLVDSTTIEDAMTFAENYQPAQQ